MGGDFDCVVAIVVVITGPMPTENGASQTSPNVAISIGDAAFAISPFPNWPMN
jgi:hypothetical protein